ncbi:MAG: hypothetical protein DRH70_01240 [Candidatus Coatesbacteria bacterium]|nr:MAG: hypothetical protein DRH70_01240 [Candidatus Coatesbacteria bacterium]
MTTHNTRESLRELIRQYGSFIEANRKAIRSLDELGKMFSKMTHVIVRSNEPFSVENVVHRCSKKHSLEEICAKLSRRLLSCMSSINVLIDTYAEIGEADTRKIKATLANIREKFLSNFWFLKRILLFNLCDDVMYFSQHKRALGLLTEIRPNVAKALRNPQEESLASGLRSVNEVVRYLHQKGEDAFFARARAMGASRTFALGNENMLNLVDLDNLLGGGDGQPGKKSLVQTLNEPVMTALLKPYREGVKGEGAEILNVVKFRDMIDTQLELGLHKARLRSRISSKSGSHKSFISLSYFEPFQALVSQTLGQRVRYFSGILSRLGFTVETDFMTFLTANFSSGAGKCKKVLSELVRAMISLKDLDELLSQPGKTEQAVSLFCQGVSNVHGYFNALRCLELAVSDQITPESLQMILKQEEFSRTEMNLLLKHDFPKIAARPNVRPETAALLRRTLEELKESLS